MNSKNKGFTLIELLVVILIIGVLAAIAIPQYQRAADKAFIASLMPILKALTDAQSFAALEKGGYPTGSYFTFNDLNIDVPVSTSSCKTTDVCQMEVAGREVTVALRKQITWANFYFGPFFTRLRHMRNHPTYQYQLECLEGDNRCPQVAKSYRAQACGEYPPNVKYFCW